MDVAFQCQGVQYPESQLVQDTEALLRELSLLEAELSLVLCTDRFIRKMNREYRGKDAPTDVLSFAMKEGMDLGIDPNQLGDLMISLDTARRQAHEQGHSLHTELRVLLVHGLLHLIGHDHQQPEQTEQMRAQERRLLQVLGEEKGLIARAFETG